MARQRGELPVGTMIQGLVLLGLILVHGELAAEQALFFTTGGGITRSQLDGGGRTVQLIPDATIGSVDFAIDHYNHKIYWTSYDASTGESVFSHVNVDGSDMMQDVFRVRAESLIRAMAIDGAAGKIYWGRSDELGFIERANLDGSDVETLVAPAGGTILLSMVLDLDADKMYWPTFGIYTSTGRILRANLDGSNVETVVGALKRPIQVALHPAADKLYWTDSHDGDIRRCNLSDGQNVESVLGSLPEPAGIVLDVSAGKMYWANFEDESIRRANLDGSDPEHLLTVSGSAFKVALGPDKPVAVSATPWSRIKSAYR